MTYRLQRDFFSLHHKMTIEDADGQAAFHIEGPFFLPGNALSVTDQDGNPVAAIEQKLFSASHTFEIHREGRIDAIVQQAFFHPFRHRFTVDDEKPDDLIAQGDLFNREYTFTRSEQEVATVSHKLFSLPDIYTVQIADGQDDVLILCCAVVINMVHHRRHH